MADIKLIQAEMDKFRANSGTAIAVMNPDGSNVGGGNISVGLVSLASSALVKASQDGTWTVAVSNPTLYAVVNTGAAGIGQSLVTVNNFPTSFQTLEQNLISLASGTQVIVNQSNPANLKATVDFSGSGLGTMQMWDGSQAVNNLVKVNNLVSVASINGKVDVNIISNLASLASVYGSITVTDKGGVIKNSILSTASGNPQLIALIDDTGHIADINANGSLDVNLLSNVTLNPSNAFIGLATTTSSSYQYAFISQSSLQVKNGAGVLNGVTISVISLPTTYIFDGTKIMGRLGPNTQLGTYYFNANFATSLSIQCNTGVNPQLTVTYN